MFKGKWITILCVALFGIALFGKLLPAGALRKGPPQRAELMSSGARLCEGETTTHKGVLDTLRYDDGVALYYFTIPDEYGDDLYNVRFTPASSCSIREAHFQFYDLSGGPDLRIYIWDDEGGFPGAKLDSVTIPADSVILYPDWMIVDLSVHDIGISSAEDFHIGYTIVNESGGDALGILSDDGLPVGTEHRSSEFWDGDWGTMFDDWGDDVNFLIRAVVEYDSLEPPGIEIDPDHIQVVAEPDSVVEATLTIRNTGGSDLRFSIALPDSPLVVQKTTIRGRERELRPVPRLEDVLLSEGQTDRFSSDVELAYDDGTPVYFFTIPDEYGDDLFNVRFTPIFDCSLKMAKFLFYEEAEWGSPDLRVYVWDDVGGFPGNKIDSVDVPGDSVVTDDWHIVEFFNKNLGFGPGEDFHIGYSIVNESAGDTLGILSDDGIPVGTEHRSSEFWNGEWGTMYDDWGVDVNFMMRAVISYTGWLFPDPLSGIVPPGEEVDVRLVFDASGLSDTTITGELVIENNAPTGPVVFPCTLVVVSDAVEEHQGAIPRRCELGENFPNPFNAITIIPYHVSSAKQVVSVQVYNLLGQAVRNLVQGPQPPGAHRAVWDGRDDRGRDVTSGIYFYRLRVGEHEMSRRMVLLR